MGEDTILPKSVRRTHPEWFEQETILGYPKGARRQYRYGNLHIREYDDHVTIHEDMYDPRTEPLQHVVYEAPEVLAGAAWGLAAGYGAYRGVKAITGSPTLGALAGFTVGAAAFAAKIYAADKNREV